MSDRDKKYLEFAERFEGEFANQDKDEDRSIVDTLDLGWDLLAVLPERDLKRVKQQFIEKYHPDHKNG